MINAEFRRDMQQNVLVLKDQEVSQGRFQEKMLEHNSLDGFLPFRIQRMDEDRMLFYDLYGVQPLSEVCKRILPNVLQLISLVESILDAIKRAAEYLLKENDLLLKLEYMFVCLPRYEVKMCYYPGYQLPIKKQLSQLFEELMSCVDYEDRNAVYLIYSLYMKSKDESCTVLDLEEVIKRSKISITDRPSDNDIYAKKPVNIEIANESLKTAKEQQKIENNSMKVEMESAKTVEVQLKADFAREQEANVKFMNSKIEKPERNRGEHEIPLAMSTSISPMELKADYINTQRKSNMVEGQHKSPVFRPLISKDCQEEIEELSYPSKCYLLGGLIVFSVVTILFLLLKTDILFDPVLKKLEPIKLVAALCILTLPSIYGLKKIFEPRNKVSKIITSDQFKLREIAATKEVVGFDIDPLISRNIQRGQAEFETDKSTLFHKDEKIQLGGEEYCPRMGNKTNLIKKRKEGEQIIDINQVNQMDQVNHMSQMSQRNQVNQMGQVDQMSQRNQVNQIKQISLEGRFEDSNFNDININETKTMLLNGVQVSPFAQLISEHPEKADSITLIDCPFYIGTVKNKMNYSLSCPVISRYHAKVEKTEGIYYIIDLNSTNGTFVNGRRLKAQEPNVLIAGDKVAFANIGFIFACPN